MIYVCKKMLTNFMLLVDISPDAFAKHFLIAAAIFLFMIFGVHQLQKIKY